MLVSYRWLCELLPDLKLPVKELAERLAQAGLPVDGITHVGAGIQGVVIAEVRAIEPHPERDKLRLVTLDTGAGTQRVVCGAPNVPDPGGRVVLATLGAKIPAFPEPLAPRKLGGILSEGMLCSLKELGLGEATEGIWVLDAKAPAPGTPLLEAYPFLEDTILDLDVTPNRGDALGHVGIARDIAACLSLPFAQPTALPKAATTPSKLSDLIEIVNMDFDRCPTYAAGLALDVKVGPSPLWLQLRLQNLGIRPISNVVDITNWILMEFGQPLHAFDLNHIAGGKIVIRRAAAGESFRTLDGVARSLDADDLVIADAEKPLALAGVMGGADSEINNSTTKVLVECAYFDGRGVRRSARRHGLHTESSHRFERGTDRGAITQVLARALSLLAEYAGASVAPEQLKSERNAYSSPKIQLRHERLENLLGTHIPFDQALGILNRLGFKTSPSKDPQGKATAEVLGTSYRHDIRIEADLIEEVARVAGLDSIEPKLPPIIPQKPTEAGQLERKATAAAMALGLSEALTYNFVSRKDLEAVKAPPPVVTIKNPMSEERSVMQTSALPGLLDALRRAQRHGEESMRLFSVAPRFLAPVSEVYSERGARARPRLPEDLASLPEERPTFTAVLAGKRAEYLAPKPAQFDVFDAKAIAVRIVEQLTLSSSTVAALDATLAPHLHPRAAGQVLLGTLRVATFGALHPDVTEALEIDGSVQVVEVDLAALETIAVRTPKYQTIPRLPPVTRDISLVVEEGISAGEVQTVIREAAGELCESVELIATFKGGSVPADHRSLTYHLVFRDPLARKAPDQARTLTDKEVDAAHEKVTSVASKKFGATLRA
ncbi:MAG: phenylalanine--tRNA ligase subunit beta [Polyangiaceae bacterium]|nr:phenylalanine--tRNA ligase subunit beta [Polyangiaceae bacterium]